MSIRSIAARPRLVLLGVALLVALAIVLTAVIPLIVFAYQARVLYDRIIAQATARS